MVTQLAAEARSAPGAGTAEMARHSSFYAALRILPRAQREAMFQVYAFCRAVDDIADGPDTRQERLAGLARWRRDIANLYLGEAVPEQLGVLAATIRHYGLQRGDFDAVIDGMLMDTEGDLRGPDWATLDLYCDRVASAVGRLSVRIFGLPQAEGGLLAHHLGRALQLTNILRDLDEDAAVGRLYLPSEALAAAGIAETQPQAVLAHPALARACAPLIARARRHFSEAAAIMASCPRSNVRAPRLMAAVYEEILDRIEQAGLAPPRRRIRLGRTGLFMALLRHGAF